MDDYFEILGVPRRPWLEATSLKQRYLQLSASVHPDRLRGAPSESIDTGQFARVNAAYQCLSDPKKRLGHLLTLEKGAPVEEVTTIDEDQAGRFMDFNALLRRTDPFLKKKEAATTALQKASLMAEGLHLADEFQAFQQRIADWMTPLIQDLQRHNASWEAAGKPASNHRRDPDALPLEEIETIYRQVSYLTRWSAQINERLTRLAL